MTLGAFGVVIVLGEKGTENTSIERDYAGIAWRHPPLAAAMALFMFSLTGIPPTAGFVGKFAILSAAVRAGHVPLAVLLVVASVISAYYYSQSRRLHGMWTFERALIRSQVPAMAVIALLIAVAGVLGLGIFPEAGWSCARVDGRSDRPPVSLRNLALALTVALASCGREPASERATEAPFGDRSAAATTKAVEIALDQCGAVPAGRTRSSIRASRDGGGSLRVDTQQGGRLRLYALDDIGEVQGRLVYTGFLKSRDLRGRRSSRCGAARRPETPPSCGA